jgi:uncharacterized protein (TIGR02246 family)
MNLILVAVAMIPAFAAEPQKGDLAADVAAINALNDKLVAAFNSNDAIAMAATFAEDAILMLSNQPAIEGRNTIQSRFEVRFKNNWVKIVNTTLEIEVAGDWAYIRGHFTHAVTPKSGGKTVEGSSKYLRILRRQSDGSWKIYRSIDNHDEAQ